MSDTVAAQQPLFDMERTFLTLNDRFLVPPFTVLDARAGYWQDRKRDWLSIGIKSELGREDKLLGFDSLTGNDAYGKKGKIEHGTSIFDPVLCEVAYRWFAPPGGTILDPFAGGSVRGIVASALGRGYLGIDLRAEQVQSNYEQVAYIKGRHNLDPRPDWVIGDSRNLPTIVGNHKFDASFTCPPYFNLERYSDDPQDLSNMRAYSDFRDVYREIIRATVDALVEDSFAVWVVGDIREKTKPSAYYGFVSDTIRSFRGAGCHFYNEAILLTMLGTVPVRVSAQFGKGRKMGKVHQNVLVFCKGDPYKAAEKIPVEEVAVEQGGATWRADGSAVGPQGETIGSYEEEVGV